MPPQPRVQPLISPPFSPACYSPRLQADEYEVASPTYSPVNKASDDGESDNDEDENDPLEDTASPAFEPVSPKSPRKGSKKFKCGDCDYESTSKTRFSEHRLKYHDFGQVTICKCGFIFINGGHYNSHMNIVKNKKHQREFKKIVEKKKKELELPNYRWSHDEYVKAPRPKDAAYVSLLRIFYCISKK